MNETRIIKWLAKGIIGGFVAAYTILGFAFHIIVTNPHLLIKQDADLVFEVTEEDVVKIISSSGENITKLVVIMAFVLIALILFVTHDAAFGIKEKREVKRYE